MAKSSGLGSSLIVGAVDLSGDVGSISVAEVSRALLDVTGMDKSAVERILGRKDGKLTYAAFWNTSAGQAHATLSTAPTGNVIVTYVHASTVGDVGASMVAKQLNYAPALGADASLLATINCEANGYGLEWGELLTGGQQTFASGTVSGTAIDLGSASTPFGAAAYLHGMSIASGTATVTIQDSADGTAYAAVTGMAFTPVSGTATERIQGATNATVRRYVRVQVTGTYTTLVALVNFVRYTEAP